MSGNFEFMPNLVKVLNQFPEIKIVISSDWRFSLTPEISWNIFGYYNDRVIGVTNKLVDGNRQSEILEYVRINQVRRFIAIDDDCRGTLFDHGCLWLFKTNYFRGLNAETTNEFISYITCFLKG
jgi:hypothetical protein